MDFSTRPAASQPASSAHSAAAAPSGGKKAKNKSGMAGQFGIATLVASIIILIIAVVGVLSFTNTTSEGKYVDTTKLQAVFLNTGQVYFGHVTSLNSKYFVLTNIYYLQTTNNASSTTSTTTKPSTSVTLVKLGCEIHEPQDRMVINATEVTFWENLEPNGQVAKAVSTFQKDNPSGQKCTDQSASSSSTSNSVQNAATSSTTPTTTTTTPTKP